MRKLLHKEIQSFGQKEGQYFQSDYVCIYVFKQNYLFFPIFLITLHVIF